MRGGVCGNVVHALHTCCKVLEVGNSSDPSLGLFPQLTCFWWMEHEFYSIDDMHFIGICATRGLEGCLVTVEGFGPHNVHTTAL